jgi:hypothetical protein
MRRGPSGLLGCDDIAIEKANLKTRIADLEKKLTLLKARLPGAVPNTPPFQSSHKNAIRPPAA